MKTLLYCNNFVVLLPIVLGILGFIDNSFWGLVLISTILTGFVQVIIALYYIFDNYKDLHIYIYFTGVIVFFTLWFTVTLINYIACIPPVLALYLTWILYRNYKTESHEP